MRKNRAFGKIFLVFTVLILFSYLNSYALDNRLLDIRNKLFEEAKAIQFKLIDSQDTGLLLTLWDSSMVTITQLNAYFYMIGIFESVKDQKPKDSSLDYLVSWLQELKRTNQMNLRNFATIVPASIRDQNTKTHIDLLKRYYTTLDTCVDTELVKVAALRKTLSVTRK